MKKILLVEDNPGDQDLIKYAFKKNQADLDIHVANDGEEALCFLKENALSEKRPDIIILDLNLPKRDGRFVLEEIKKDVALKCIPVIILTSSSAAKDIHTCYELQANSYFAKPSLFKEFEEIVTKIRDYWLTHAKLTNGFTL